MSDIKKVQANRMAKFKKMGLPINAGQINQMSEVVASGSQGAYKTLQNIKRGANRDSFKKFIDAEKNAGSADAGYQIPVSKPKPRPGQKQEKSSHAVAPTAFNARKSAEADSLENMMLGETSLNISSTINEMGTSQEQTISEISGPAFDPISYLQQRAAEKESESQQSVVYQENNEISEMRAMIESLLKSQTHNSGNDLTEIKKMMHTIAKQVAESTIKTVINEFLAESKKKNIYEVYNKKQNVIKINNKLYKLTPVKIKN